MTFNEAYCEILDIFYNAWCPDPQNERCGYTIHFGDVHAERSSIREPWVMVSVQHSTGFQSTLSSDLGSRLFTRLGFINISIFTPSGDGLPKAYELAKVVADAYEGTHSPGGAWFRDVRINEVGRDGDFHRLDVIIDFRYDEIK